MKHKDYLFEQLQDDEFAVEYLRECLNLDEASFLLALKDLIEARHIKKARVAKAAGIQRESLYAILTETGNPGFSSLRKILESVGFRFSIERVEDQQNTLV